MGKTRDFKKTGDRKGTLHTKIETIKDKNDKYLTEAEDIKKRWQEYTEKKLSKKKRSFFPFIFISWRLITLQYCSVFCHTFTGISHGFACVPHPEPPSHLPLHPIPLGLPSAPALSTCLMHPIWTGDLFHT